MSTISNTKREGINLNPELAGQVGRSSKELPPIYSTAHFWISLSPWHATQVCLDWLSSGKQGTPIQANMLPYFQISFQLHRTHQVPRSSHCGHEPRTGYIISQHRNAIEHVYFDQDHWYGRLTVDGSAQKYGLLGGAMQMDVWHRWQVRNSLNLIRKIHYCRNITPVT